MKTKHILVVAIFAFFILIILRGSIMRLKFNANLIIPVLKGNLVLDPHKMEDLYSMLLNVQLHRGLFRYLPSGEIASDIVESWNKINAGKTYIFKLKSVFFSDGTTIYANDVAKSFQRIFLSDASISLDLSIINGSERFKKTKNVNDLGIRVLSEHEIEFNLSKPSDLFIPLLAVADCAILKLDMDYSIIDYRKPNATSGPYKLVSYSETQVDIELWQTVLYPKAPKFVTFKQMSFEEAILAAKTNKVDSLDIYPIDITNYDINPSSWKHIITSLAYENFLLINPNKVPSSVRKLVAFAADSEEIIKLLKLPYLKAAYGLIPPFIPGAISEKINKRINNDNSNLFTLNIKYAKNNLLHEKTILYLKDKLKKYNIEIKQMPLNIDQYLNDLFSKNSDAILAGKGMDYPDGYSNLAYYIAGNSSNYYFSENSNLNDRILNLPFINDHNQRIRAYIEIQHEILKQNTFIPLYFGNNASGLWNARIRYVPEHPLGIQFLPFELIEM